MLVLFLTLLISLTARWLVGGEDSGDICFIVLLQELRCSKIPVLSSFVLGLSTGNSTNIVHS